jgi:hypothetical protein
MLFIVPIVAAGGAAFVGVTAYLARSVVADLAKAFPPQPEEADAETRERQTLNVGHANMSWGFSMTSDATYVHVRPGPLLKTFGATPFSLPRAQIKVVATHGEWATVEIDGRLIEGPRWCLAPEGVIEA